MNIPVCHGDQSARRLPAQLDKNGRGLCGGGGDAPVRTWLAGGRRWLVVGVPMVGRLTFQVGSVGSGIGCDRLEVGHVAAYVRSLPAALTLRVYRAYVLKYRCVKIVLNWCNCIL